MVLIAPYKLVERMILVRFFKSFMTFLLATLTILGILTVGASAGVEGDEFTYALTVDGVVVGKPFLMNLDTHLQHFVGTIDGPIKWTLDSGMLPDGLVLSTAGVISGTPTARGSFSFIVTAEYGTDSNTKIEVSIACSPVWIYKLPSWLGWIGKLPGFLQTIIYYVFFGWVWNFK
jgi:hypothetical protein